MIDDELLIRVRRRIDAEALTQAQVAAAAMTFDSIDMSRRALSSRLESVLAAPRRQGAWQASLGGQGRGGFSASEVPLSGWLMGHDQLLGEGRIGGLAFGITCLCALAAFIAPETYRVPMSELGKPGAKPMDKAEYDAARQNSVNEASH